MKELHKALLEVQKELKTIQTDSTGRAGSGEFQYASLEQVLSKSEPVLHKHGLLLTQFGEVINGQNVQTTSIIHVETGQEKQSSYILVTDKAGPQGLGSSITYLRRYQPLGLLGKATGDDPDSAIQKTYDAAESRSVGKGTASKGGVSTWKVANGYQWRFKTYAEVPIAELRLHAAKLRKKSAGDRNQYEEKFLTDLAIYEMEDSCQDEPEYSDMEPEDLRNRFGP